LSFQSNRIGISSPVIDPKSGRSLHRPDIRSWAGGMAGGFILGSKVPVRGGVGAAIDAVINNPPNIPLPGSGSPIFDCFVDGTPVWTAEGSVDISAVEPGSRVLSGDPVVETSSVQTIIAKRSRLVHELVLIHLAEETLRCTSQHPFWTDARGWIAAGDLTAGDVLRDVTGKGVPVLKIETKTVLDAVRVQTITVGGTHTYYVGKSKVLVHNKPLG